MHIRILIVFLSLFVFQGFAQNTDECPHSEVKKAKKLYEKALDVMRSSKAEARSLLLEALELDPDYAQANLVLGDLSFKSKKMDQAEKYYLRAVEICPEVDAMVYFRLGGIEFGDKKYRESKEHFEKFIKTGKGSLEDQSDARDQLKASIFYLEGFATPVPFNPKPLSQISSAADEYLPIITPDNKRAYFTRRTFEKEKFTGGINVETKPIERFTFSESVSDNNYTEGTPMPDPFNKNSNEGGASLSADNKYMYFTICRDEGGELLNCDIWYSVFSNGIWSEIKNAGPEINGKTTWESQPSLSSDGKTLYFASNREGGEGQLDIWKSVREKNGTWGKPINLGPSINTPENEKSPFFHSDGKTLYFSSTGHLGYGGYDIYFSKLGENDQWATPKNIGYPINSEKDDLGFFVSTDGKTGYFASDKLKGVGGWDVYQFGLYKEARPERVLFLTGEIRDEGNLAAIDAKVELKNTKTQEVTTVDVDSLTGKYVAVVSFNDDHILTVKQAGKAFTSNYFSTSDSTITAKPMETDMKVEEIKVGKAYRINNINFETNSSELSQQSKHIILEFAAFLKDNPGVNVSIQGHTDNVGDATSNMKLSVERAAAVKQFLLEQSIAGERLDSKGFGMNKPVASNKSEAGRAKNRRTEFVILSK
jgi:outer membrane protein OmpA-like peptidoglycan-associated protein/tetratricopeptide (TPR) repeat protein/YHS domain-containing protein